MVFQNIMMGAAGQGSGYEIDQSIRFNDDDSASLSRTSGSADSERKLASTSVWLKRSNLTSRHTIYAVNPAGSAGAANQITMVFENSGSNGDCITYNNGSVNRQSTSVYRDVSAWYHFCQIFDTTQSTAADRVKTYINGTLLTDINIGQDFSLNSNTAFGQNGVVHYLARGGSTQYFDGYMAEIIFTVGQSVTVANFGETNDDGVWIPKKYTGAFGTNGFFIDGRDSSDLGDDESGNGNDFTSSGLAAADQMFDSPTLNYPTISSIDFQTGSNVTLTDGNLNFANANSGAANDARATFAVSSGKWYWEVEADSLGQSGVNREFIGIVGIEFDITAGSAGANFSADSSGFAFATTGQKVNGGTAASYGNAYTAGQYIGVALDLDNGKIYWSINGTFQNSGDPAGGSGEAYSSISGTFAPAFAVDFGTGTSRLIANFGQSAFQNDPPTGFKQLNSANLPAPTIKDGSEYFHTQLYTGTGSSGLAITNDANYGDFQPDLLWIAPRSNGDNHVFWDVVRGTTKRLKSNSADAGDTDDPAQVTFETDGFDLDTTDANFNGSSRTYAAWQWKTSGGAGSSNTDGSISSTVSANATAKFSIVKYVSNNTAGATVGHGLGVAPDMIITKNQEDERNWGVYFSKLGATKAMFLNLNNAASTSSVYYNDTEPTSSVFSLGTSGGETNFPASDAFIAYCFAEIEGYSKFGSYTGNGSSTNGPFIYTGFKPAFVMFKKHSATDSWEIFDNKRPGYNATGLGLLADTTAAESTGRNIDILSNGIKQRNANGTTNEDGNTYVYMAFAENPFGGDGVAPATAR